MGLFKTKALSFLNPATFTSLPASFLSFFFFFEDQRNKKQTLLFEEIRIF